MSIDELGTRLVREGRRRRDRQRKRQEKFQTRAAIAQIAVPVAGRIIEDNLQQKAQDFFNQEEVLNLKRQHSKAVREANSIFGTRDAIAASGLSDEDYFYNQVFPTVESEMMDAANLAEQTEGKNILGRNVKTGLPSNQEFIGSIKRNATELATERVNTYRESLAAAEGIVSSDQFDSMMANKLKDSTPTSIVDAVGRKVSTFFGGASTEERQNIALNDIRNHHFSDDARALSAFNDKYKDTRDIRSALEFGEIIKEVGEFENRVVREIPGEQVLKLKNDRIVRLPFTTEIMQDGSEGRKKYGVATSIPGLEGGLTPEEELADVRAARSSYNVMAIGSRILGDATFQREFVNKLSDNERFVRENGSLIIPGTEQTMGEFSLVQKAYVNFIRENTNLIGEEEQLKLFAQSSIEMGEQLFLADDSIQDLLVNLNEAGLGKKINDPVFNKVFNHIVRASTEETDIGDYRSSNITSEDFLNNSAVAYNLLDYIEKRSAYRNVLNADSSFYRLMRETIGN